MVVGLGNIGERYTYTRHNVGFLFVDKLLESFHVKMSKKGSYGISSAFIDNNKVFFIKPLTYMNRSGFALKEFFRYNEPEIPSSNIIVVHDDLDIELGRVKLKRNSSSGGHKGVQSIIDFIGTKDFIRVKIGIDRIFHIPVEDYVLSRFKPNELEAIGEVLFAGPEIIETIVCDGPDRAMNKYNSFFSRTKDDIE